MAILLDGARRVLRGLAYETMVFTVAAFVPFVGIPATVHAQESQFTPLEITGALNLSRGSYTPESAEAFTLPREQYCNLVTKDWGWESCEGIDAFVISATPESDTTIVEMATNEGYVKFDDWTEESSGQMVEAIEDQLYESAKAQSERSGSRIEFRGWRVDPTLDRARSVMYYATDWAFDGEISTNIKAIQLDRRGFVVMAIVPVDSTLGSGVIEALIQDNLASYRPRVGEDYASFTAGDKVAAVGAVGLLGTFFGVKYGKAVATGAIAVAVAFAKKFIFVFVLGGLALLGVARRWIMGLFRRDRGVT